MDLGKAFLVVFAPTAYILLACLAFSQFAMVFNAISSAAFHMQRQPALEAFAPILTAYVRYLESIFGWVPGATGHRCDLMWYLFNRSPPAARAVGL